MKKIIIFGGSFDPIHEGHISIAINAMRKINADKIFFVLSHNSPNDKISRAKWEDRINMIKIAIKNYDNFFIEEFEKNDNNNISYTWKTIEYFKNKYKGDKLFLLMGSDQYYNFNSWKNKNYILENTTIICHYRKNFNILVDNNLIVLEEEDYDTSSTDLIMRPNDMLNIGVLNYINKYSIYSIYRLENEGLSKKRIEHCIDVANLSKQIANKYNEEIILKAYSAGIYHDIAKEISQEKLIMYADKLLNYKNYPSWKVIHAPLGSYILKNKYKYNDEDILNAIAYHSIPQISPTLIEKIVFCADKLSYREDRETDNELLDICKNDIELGFNMILEKNKEWIKGN